MFHQQIYDLSRQVHAEYNAKFERLYVPLQDVKPGLPGRLLVALRDFVVLRALKPVPQDQAQQANAGSVAK